METKKNIDREFFRINIGYYLIKSPECDLEWIKKIIGNCLIPPHDLKEIMYEMEGFGDKKRYKKLLKMFLE